LIRPQQDLKDVTFTFPSPDDESKRVRGTLSVMQLRKLELLQQWFFEQDDNSEHVWLELDASSFRAWTTSTTLRQNSVFNNANNSFNPVTPNSEVLHSPPVNPNVSSAFIQSPSQTVVESEAASFKK
jgi:hypothetical protein